MRAGNKFQRNLVEIDKSLPKISSAQKRWAFDNCLMHKGIRQKSGKITCLDCGHHWQSDLNQSWMDSLFVGTCPNCSTELKIESLRNRNFLDYDYLTMVNIHKGFQVIRKFDVRGHYKLGERARLNIREISRIYIAPDGNYGIIGNSFMNTFYGEKWFGSFELKHNNTIENHSFRTNYVYPRKRFLPEIIRNGFRGDTYNLPYFKFFYAILSNPKAETLLKSGQKQLFKSCTNYREVGKIEKYWNSIKICLRKNFIIRDISDYFDYLGMLEFFGKDLNNPKYVCPENIGKEHDKYTEKMGVVLEKRRIEELEKQMQIDEENYFKLKHKYFGLKFEDKNIKVEVIDKVSKVQELGKMFKHCIYVNEYHREENSLLLCALVDDEPIETIEFDLTEFKVVQSRGLKNKASKFNKKIVKLVNNHSQEIKRLALKRKKSA